MKHNANALKSLVVAALMALALGCASDDQNKQNLAIAAGFKVITPQNAEQASILVSLPDNKVTPISYKGHRLYVLPDKARHEAYVGRTQEYQAYEQLRLAQHLSNENLEAAQMNQMASMNYNWGAWGGWGGGWGWGWR